MKTSSSRSKRGGGRGRRKRINLKALRDEKKRVAPFHTMQIADFYKPLKKPVTLRLDADVIAWFKKDGRRYQTRINAALRTVMEKEIKKAG